MSGDERAERVLPPEAEVLRESYHAAMAESGRLPAGRPELADLLAPYRQARPPARHVANVRIPAALTTEATR